MPDRSLDRITPTPNPGGGTPAFARIDYEARAGYLDDQVLDARVQALHAAIAEAGTLLRGAGPMAPHDRGIERDRVIVRAETFETWLLRADPTRSAR